MGRIGLTPGLFPISTAEEMHAFGQKIAKELPENAILALSGQLGAGKTTFVQGLALGLGIEEQIQSPTFVLLNLYDNLAHFDLYRIKGESDFLSLGFDDYFQNGRIVAIEWPERIPNILPPSTIRIHFSHDETGRLAEVQI